MYIHFVWIYDGPGINTHSLCRWVHQAKSSFKLQLVGVDSNRPTIRELYLVTGGSPQRIPTLRYFAGAVAPLIFFKIEPEHF